MKTFLANAVMMFSALWAVAQPAPVAGGPPAAPKPVPRVIAIRANLPLNDITTNLPPLTVSMDAPLKLGRPVLVTVSNLSTLLQDGRDKGKKVVLFVDGNELPDVEPTGISLEKETLRFQLKRTATNKAVWTPLLQNPIEPEFRPLLISVGLHGEQPLLVDEAARGALLQLIGWNTMTCVWLAVFGFLLLVFLVMAFGSDILRSPPNEKGERGAYSLARVQAAYWLFLTAMSFAFIWVVTSDLTALNSSVLALLGISAGTYVASGMLSQPPTPEQLEKDKEAQAEAQAAKDKLSRLKKDSEAKAALAKTAKENLKQAQKELVGAPNDDGIKLKVTGAANACTASQKESDTAAEAFATAKAALPRHERLATNFRRLPIFGQFLEDILTDDAGVSVHRFQMLVWTMVMGTVFVFSVAQDLVMPEFSATLLGLMGVSSATFLAPKIAPK